MNAEDRAYLAGLVDGEGTICVCRSRRLIHGSVSPNYVVKLAIVMTHEPVIRFIHSLTGMGSVTGGYLCKSQVNSKLPLWSWVAERQKLAQLLTELLPYLRVKREQAQLAVEFTRILSVKNRRGRRLTNEEINLREHFRTRMSSLNGRKPHKSAIVDGVLAKRGVVSSSAV